jgi:hypothetical protein
MIKRMILWSAGALALIGAALIWWLLVAGEPGERIAGTEGALARAEPESEFVLAEALEVAQSLAQEQGARALLVHRRGHRVFEYFRSGTTGMELVDGGELAQAVLELSLHQPGHEVVAERGVAAALVSERLWLPLRAGEAWLAADTDAKFRSCCIEARLDDWMRVGDLLLGTGSYHGERIVSADAVRALLAAHPASWRGDEPLLAGDGVSFDLAPGLRLWLAPRRQLGMLVWADVAAARDTQIPNIILRGLNDAAPAVGGGIGDIVPGH